MNAVKLIAVFVQNQPGQTARITKILADAGVNIRWVTIANTGSYGVMKFLVNDSERALQVLKQQGLMVSSLDVLAVEVTDQPGALHAVAAVLARHQVNLENTSGFVANHRAVLLIETQDLPRARTILAQEGLRFLTQEEMLKL